MANKGNVPESGLQRAEWWKNFSDQLIEVFGKNTFTEEELTKDFYTSLHIFCGNCFETPEGLVDLDWFWHEDVRNWLLAPNKAEEEQRQRVASQPDWPTIMEMENPHEALKAIAKKIDIENLSITEMEERIEEYATIHSIDLDKMGYYPNGGRVLDPDDIWTQEYEAKLGKILFYFPDGKLAHQYELKEGNLGRVLGMMARCFLKNGDICEGFADPYRLYGEPKYDEEVHDFIYLWTWTHFDEETHSLTGEGHTKYERTFTPIAIDKIIRMDAILYSNPRWGGGLINRFFLEIT